MFRSVVLAALLAASAAAAATAECRVLAPMTNFDAQKFSGSWYTSQAVVIRGINFKEDTTYGCTISNYTFDGSTLVLNASVVKQSTRIVYVLTMEQDAGSDQAAKFEMNKQNLHTTWSIAATDYNNYAVLYACITNNDQVIEEIIILSRAKSLGADAKAAADKFLQANNVTSVFVDFDNSDQACYYNSANRKCFVFVLVLVFLFHLAINSL